MNSTELAAMVGERLKALRQQLEATQEQVAEWSGLSVSYIGMLERGDRLPHMDVLFSIATALKMPITYFLAPAGLPCSLLAHHRVQPFSTVVEKLKLSPEDVTAGARILWFIHSNEKFPDLGSV